MGFWEKNLVDSRGSNSQGVKPGARLISIGGGKGGVGKSIVSSNLAAAMAQAGHRVVIADLDLGAANLHLLLGVQRPKPGLSILLSPEGNLAEALSETKLPNLRLLAGAGGTAHAANISHGEKLRIIRRLRSLPADIVVVDVGAGVGYNALDFFELGAQRLVVATPQVTSIHDAYAFLKGAVLRTLRHHAEKASDVALLEPAATSKEGEKVSEMLTRIRERDPAFGDKVQRILKHFGAYLVGNQVQDPSQVGVFQAVSKMILDYLGIEVPILGWIRANPRIAESVNDRNPLLFRQSQQSSEDGRTFRAMMDALLAGEGAPEEELLVELEDEDAAPARPAPPVELRPDDIALAPARSGETPASPPPPPKPGAPPLPPARGAAAPATGPAPPPLPARAAAPAADGAPRAAAPGPAPAGEPASPVKPRVYVRPPRKRKDAEEPPKEKAKDPSGRGRRRSTLPGMTPVRG
jgi:flagellar biosynthesis protein FlhG